VSGKRYVRWQDRQPRDLPSLERKWTHWWIEGDGYPLGIVARDDPARAHRIVNENKERMRQIFAYRAKIDPVSGQFVRQEGRRYQITERDP
jgi:hypothetical protein